jgi:hypothetical protein
MGLFRTAWRSYGVIRSYSSNAMRVQGEQMEISCVFHTHSATGSEPVAPACGGGYNRAGELNTGPDCPGPGQSPLRASSGMTVAADMHTLECLAGTETDEAGRRAMDSRDGR